MKYVLTQQAKDFIFSVVKSPERAKEIIKKAEICFNNEMDYVDFLLGDMKKGSMSVCTAKIFLNRYFCAKQVEDWQLSDEEIDSIGDAKLSA